MFNTKLIKNIPSKSSPCMKKIACIDGGFFLFFFSVPYSGELADMAMTLVTNFCYILSAI